MYRPIWRHIYKDGTWVRCASSGKKKCKEEKPVCKYSPGALVGRAEQGKVKDVEEMPCVSVKPRVAVLGAGLAGLSAAQRLASVGLDNFVIIEASDRVGGRVNSAWSGECVNEWGAQWLEGEWNPLLRLASLEGLQVCKRPSALTYLAPDGRALDPPTTAKASSAFKRIREMAQSVFTMEDPKEESLGHFLDKSIIQLGETEADSKRLVKAMGRNVGKRWGARPDDVSTKYFGSVIEAGEETCVAEGLSGALAPILRDIPGDNIVLCKPVRYINWGCPGKVELIYCDKSTEKFDYVVVTFSLGVLKENKDLFNPELPEQKLSAIESLGYGVVNKIFLDYKDAFWLKGEGSFFLSQEKGDDWKSSIFQVDEVCCGKSTLEVCVAGPGALELEQVDEETIAREVTKLFRDYTGVRILPYPVGVTRTKWYDDPYFVGSCSYLKVGSCIESQCMLGQPLPGPYSPEPPRLLFAGEATVPGYFATVQGARMSGFREAERIIALTKKFAGPPTQCTIDTSSP